MPKTTDELYEVLKAFKENDANGNGVQDELGVYGFTDGGYGQDIIDSLMNSFVFYNGGAQNNGLALDESGEHVIAPFATEEWREGLWYMNKLYTEGLLASSTFTDNDTAFKATLNSETNVVGLTSAGSTSNWPDADNNANFLEMDLIEPLTGPNGVCYTPYTEYAPGASFFITSSCENPDLAFKLGDWFMDIDNSRIARWGEEGVDWTSDPEHVLPLLHYTSEEASQCTEAMVSIADLVEQAKAEFITGVRDLDSGWDAYLEELESVGLSSWLEIAQTAYERSQAN